jgi:hypothetical protein
MPQLNSKNWSLSILMPRKRELCELFAEKTGLQGQSNRHLSHFAQIGIKSPKKTRYSSQAATERVQKLRCEYCEKIKDIPPENFLVFLEETGIIPSLEPHSCPLTTRDENPQFKTLLSRSKSNSNWSY